MIKVTSTPNTQVSKEVEKAESAKSPEASVAEETQAETIDASESSNDEIKDGDGPKSEGLSDEPKKSDDVPKGVKKKIDKLTKRLSDKDREIEFLRGQLEKGKPAAVEAKEIPKTREGKPVRPDVNKFDSHDAYEAARDQYFEDLADWKAEQKIKERDQKAKEVEVKTQVQRQVDAHQERVKEFVKEHKDFDDVIESVDDVPISLAVKNAILSSDVGPSIMYALASDRKEYERICALSPEDAYRAIGRLEAKLDGGKTSPKEEKKISKAPAPIKPAEGGSSKPATSIFEAKSQSEYEAIRREQMKRKSAWG